MRILRRVLAFALIAIALVSCSRDPNVRKKKYLDSGNTYFKRGRYKEASIFYRRALAQDPKYGDAYYHLALTSMKLRETANAVPYLRRAVELLPPGTPDATDANLQLAEILVYAASLPDAQGKNRALLDEIEQISRKLLARDPNSFEGHKLKAELARVEAVELYQKKDMAGAKKGLEDTIAEYRRALQIKPGDQPTSMDLARTLAAFGEIGEAQQLYREIIDKDKTALAAYSELYKLYFTQRKLTEAEAVLKKGIANNPKDFAFQTLLAAHYFQTGNRPEMTKVLNDLKAHAKEFEAAYRTAGDFYYRTGDGDEAIRQFQEGIAHDPKQRLEYQKRIVEVLIRQGKTAQAYEKVIDILKEFPKDAEARGLRANFLLDKGEINQAITELQSVVTAKPDNFVARFNLGRAHFAKQEYEQARQQFQEAVRLRPDYMAARLALTQIALARGDNDAALKNAEEIEKIYPNSGAAKLLESAALMRLGRLGESRVILETILRTNPKQPDALLEMGVLNLLEKKYAEAQDFFRRGYEADPANLRGLLGEVETLFIQRQPEAAAKLMEAAAQQYPNRLDLKRELANVELRTGQYDKALAQYLDLLDKYKGSPHQQGDVYARLGETYARKNDPARSIESLRKAKDLLPDNVQVLNNLALMLDSTGKHKDARQVYELTLRTDPNNPIALNNLAYLMAETGGNLDEALTLANRAKQQLPNFFEVSDTIGWIYLKKNLSDNAIEIFRELTAKVPQNSTYHYHYAMALMQKGDKQQARKECQAALERKPSKEEEGRIQDLMNRIA